jgi:hypothetical protein
MFGLGILFTLHTEWKQEVWFGDIITLLHRGHTREEKTNKLKPRDIKMNLDIFLYVIATNQLLASHIFLFVIASSICNLSVFLKSSLILIHY